MPANQFGRYVWLVDTLRRYKHLSYKEINAKWQQSGLSYGEGDELPLRTFHNHRKAIYDIFNIAIELDPDVKGYKYHIENPIELEDDSLRSWLIDSYATLNQIQVDSKLKDRIVFEDIPSGNTWLTTFMQAMRENKVMKITHQGFGKDFPNTFEIEPYCLKVVKRRWYVIANNPYYTALNKKHKEEEGYSPRKEIHESQNEIETCEESATFSYHVRLTYDFVQLIMQQGDQIEVLEPKKLRDQIRNMANTLLSYYKD